MAIRKTIQNRLICLFIFLNFFTVFLINTPQPLQSFWSDWFNHHKSEQLRYLTETLNYRIRQYAYFTGLDTRWEMFSTVKGPDWRYQIEGLCEHGAWILPLPGQSQRNLLDEWFFDFKEGKFRLNTAANPAGRHAYVQYLCKKFVYHQNHKIHAIRLNIQYQDILTPDKSLRQGHHYSDQIQTFVLETVQCG